MNVTTVEDMSVLLDGLKLDKYPIMMYTGAGAKNLLALTVAALKGAGHDVKPCAALSAATRSASW